MLKKEKKFLRRKKYRAALTGRGKGFCVMRDGPKSSCESHDTGLGITFFDAWFGILQAQSVIYQLDFLLNWTLWSRRILWFKDIHAFRFPP